MKKSLIYTSAASLALLAGVATTVLLNNASAETNGASSTLESITDPTTLGTALSGSKNETVYVITDAAGTPTKTFLGNILETSESDLPIALKITYTLDGREISASDLAGQSGHVKVTYQVAPTKSYQGKLIPFLTLTGISLDSSKFTNLKTENAKIISEGDSTMLAGYTFAGLSQDLNTDLISNSFTIEADVTDFALETVYTIATNEIFAEIDTSKLSTVDDLISSINQLGDGISQILDGATQLDDGIGQLASGIKELQSGATALNSGASDLASGASELSTGLNTLADNNEKLQSGATQTFNIFLGQTSASINANQTLAYLIQNHGSTFGLTYPVSLSINNYSDNLTKIIALVNYVQGDPSEIESAKTSLDSYNEFYLGLITYTTGVSQAASGAADLSAGADQLASGTAALESGTDQLASGSTELQSGSQALKDGIATFKRDGIDQLVDFATNDLANFTANLRSTVSAAKSYHSYKSTSAESVKFIFKTPSTK